MSTWFPSAPPPPDPFQFTHQLIIDIEAKYAALEAELGLDHEEIVAILAKQYDRRLIDLFLGVHNKRVSDRNISEALVRGATLLFPMMLLFMLVRGWAG